MNAHFHQLFIQILGDKQLVALTLQLGEIREDTMILLTQIKLTLASTKPQTFKNNENKMET